MGRYRLRSFSWALPSTAVSLAIACGGTPSEDEGGAVPVTSATDGETGVASDSEPDTTSISETAADADGAESDEGSTGSSDATASADASDSGSGTDGVSTDDPDLPGGGTWSVGSFDLPIDGTTIPLTLYVPDGSGPYPVVIFTHGFQLGPNNYATYGEHLASWGYVVVMPQMPGSLFDPTDHTTLRDYVVAIMDWAEIEGLETDGPLRGVGDASMLALAGHSMGGKVSLLTAASDPRPRVVFGVDPVDTAGGPGQAPTPENPSVTPELMPAITARLALVGETTNATGGVGGACAPEADNFHQYFTHASSPGIEIEFVTANHMSFLDDPNCGLQCNVCTAGTDDPALTLRMTRGYLVAFLESFIRDDAAYEVWLTGEPMQGDVNAGLVTFSTANGF